MKPFHSHSPSIASESASSAQGHARLRSSADIIAVARDQPTRSEPTRPAWSFVGVRSHVGGGSGLAERTPSHKREVGHAKAGPFSCNRSRQLSAVARNGA